MSKILVQRLAIIFVALFALLASINSAHAQPFGATGLLEETPSGRAWLDQHFPRTTKINFNSLAFARINSDRRKKGLRPFSARELPLSPMGDEASFQADATTSEIVVAAVPAQVDNSALPAFPPIRSQGGVGSCVAWATTYYQLSYQSNLTKGLNAKSGDNSLLRSPKWTYNMINGGVDGGSTFSSAYTLLTQNGAPSWAEVPYDANYLAWTTNGQHWRNALNYRVRTNSGSISNSNPSALVASIKQQLTNGYVLVFGTYINSWSFVSVKDDPSTNADDAFVGQRAATYQRNTYQGAHGMTFVGYDDSIWIDVNQNGVLDAGEKGALKVANSWGTGWTNGNAGYVWVAYDAIGATSGVAGAPTDRSAFLQSNKVYWISLPPYNPKFVAQFTYSHASRSQSQLSLGIGSPSQITASSVWTSGALKYQGGSFGFSGTTTEIPGTFALDFTDLNPNPVQGTTYRWFLRGSDSKVGAPETITDFRLYDGDGVLLGNAANMPAVSDGSTSWSWVDYQTGIGNKAPTAVAASYPSSGYAPLAVTFDGAGSFDPDGSIVGYVWNFGDGTTGSGASVNKTYSQPGTYVAVLTVTDSGGATAAQTAAVDVAESVTSLLAPSNLSASVSGSTVRLSWVNRSTQNTGYILQRAKKTKGSTLPSWATIQTITSKLTTTATDQPGRGTFLYRVFAISGSGSSDASNQAQARVR